MLVRQLLQPARLDGGSAGGVGRGDMNRFDETKLGHVGEVIVEQIIARKRRRITEHHFLRPIRRQPRIPAGLEVPHMVVAIDHVAVVHPARLSSCPAVRHSGIHHTDLTRHAQPPAAMPARATDWNVRVVGGEK